MQSKEDFEREQALMKSWLVFLPEIRQEIQPFFALAQNKNLAARLQESLSSLDKLPDVEEILKESDSKKLRTTFQEFEKAKSIARLAILELRINVDLGLNGWRLGRHTVRNGSGRGASDFKVTRLWAANILPAFYMPARVVVTYEPTCYRIAFGFGISPENISTSVVQMEVPPNWIDPLEKPLRNLDLFQDDRTITLDGIGYELYHLSWASETFIRFGNPQIAPYTEFEKVIWHIAKTVIEAKGQQSEKDYLARWQR